MHFESITTHISRLKVPFEDLYTAVFLFESKGKYLLFDTATTASDVTECILPALEAMSAFPEYLVCSHLHEDHAGGLSSLAKAFPDSAVAVFSQNYTLDGRTVHYLSDGERLLERFCVVHLPGHTEDSIALYDTVDRVLVTADCLQLYGVSRYGTGVTRPADYRDSLARVRALSPEVIIASHEYVPYGSVARGAQEIGHCLDACEAALSLAEGLIDQFPACSCEELAAHYKMAHPQLPPVGAWTFDSLQKAQ